MFLSLEQITAHGKEGNRSWYSALLLSRLHPTDLKFRYTDQTEDPSDIQMCIRDSSKSKAYKTLGKVSGIPALFNINTAILFTFPTVLNPIMLIPFVLTPVVNAVITYLAMMTNLVPYTTGVTLPWTTPPIIGGFLATGSWRGAVLQIVLVAVSFMIYFPFFKAADKRNLERCV